jgi:hypothetical protein
MAYNFTAASSQYLSAPAPVTTLPITMACWFRVASPSTFNAFLSTSTTSGSINRHTLLVNVNELRLQTQFASGPPATAVATAAPSTEWHHGAAVVNSTASRTVFLDGGNSNTNTTSLGTVTPTALHIGARFAFSFGGFTNGLIAEVGIWNVALTADEIASLAKGMTCDKVRPQSLVFYAPLVRDLNDQKGGLTITNNNGATVAAHTRVYA